MYSMSYSGTPGQNGYMLEIDVEDTNSVPTAFQLEQKFLSNEMKDVFVTDAFEAQVLAWRQSWVAYDGSRNVVGRYPQFYSFKNNPVEGMTYRKSHMQLMLLIDGVAEPVVFGGHGITKTVQLDNDFSYKAHAEWPYGLVPQLRELAGHATEELKTQITPHLTFKALFSYFRDDAGKPKVVTAGSGSATTAVVPWAATTLDGWRDAFVGAEAYRKNLVWWDEFGRQWVNDWATRDAILEAEARDRPSDEGMAEPGADALAALTDLPF